MEKYYLEQAPLHDNYQRWIECLERQDEPYRELEYQPKISVLVPVYNVLDKHLIPCIESVRNQSYSNWELCIADDYSTWKNVRRTLKTYEGIDKIKITYRNENGHISRCTNTALEMATGEFIAFLDCDDLLAPNALFEVVKVLNENPDLDFIYSDEDKTDDNGLKRFMPFFKSDWAPDTLMNFMYTCHLGVYRREMAVKLGGLRIGFEGAQDYDFTLRFTEKTDKIAHISKILYQWRVRDESTAGTPTAKPYILEAARKCLEEALQRRHLQGQVELVKEQYQYRINYFFESWPKVSVIIPSKDNYNILKTCLDTFHEITDYPNYEIVLVDNGSSEENRKKYEEITAKYGIKYIYQKEEFNFSHMCNVGAKYATGEYLLFLNDDIEIINEKWLKRMVGQASLDHIGAVGAKLLYPDRKTIQHDGVLNLECGPSHALTGFSDERVYYFGRNRMDYNYMAVTAACLLVKKSKYNEISGFNEDIAVSYNDIEFCFHLLDKGYYNIIRNDAILVHHESISRGLDLVDEIKYERLMTEQQKLYELYPQFSRGIDPCYNKNLCQNYVDFSFNDNVVESDIQNKKIAILGNVKQAKYNQEVFIDSVFFGEVVCISGWFFWRDSFYTNSSIVFLALKNDKGEAVYFDVERKIRKDIAEHLENVAYNSGFECRISYEDMRFNEESYQIGIVLETPRIHQKRVIWTEWNTELVSEDEYLNRLIQSPKRIYTGEESAGFDLEETYQLEIEEINRESGWIRGWAINLNSKENDLITWRFAYRIGEEVFSVPVVRRKRLDVAATYLTVPDAFWCGFEARLPKKHVNIVDEKNFWIIFE
ncbi:MAG: glycosyltransferase [Bacteroides fragilis]|nr:glycosyltransferase [Bacteroides fragilis]